MRKGFTLIELLLVIGVIGILAAIVIVAINPLRQLAQARNTMRQRDAGEILRALQQHVVDREALPDGIDGMLRMIGTASAGCDVSCGSSLGPATPFSVRVAASADDAEEEIATDDIVYIPSSDLEIVRDYNPGVQDQLIGVRFQNVTIPQGAVIASASIQFTADLDDGYGAEATSLSIVGEDSDDAVAFSTAANNISTRPRTAATVAWNSIPDWSHNTTYDTPDLSSIIQEIVDRGGWQSGNNLVLMIEGSGRRPAYSFDGNAPAAPLLSVSYQVVGITAPACIDLSAALAGTYLSSSLPVDPAYGSGAKTYYAVRTTDANNRLSIEACGAELGEAIVVEQ